MRILLLAHRIPYPPHTGDKVRPYHLARGLARRHQVTLAFLVDDAADRSGVAPLRARFPDIEFVCVSRPLALARGVTGLLGGGALSVGYFASPYLRRRLARRAEEAAWDLVYVSSSPMAQYALPLSPTPMIMDFVDVDSDKWRQYAERKRPPLSWLYALEARRLRRFEAAVARRARISLLVTAADEALLRSSAPEAPTAVVPNGVDLDYYQPQPSRHGGPVAIFTGAMDYFPNADAAVHFATEILPRVRRTVPEARFLVVGLNPTAAVRRLERLPGVTVTGTVPDVRPYYAQASVAVAPLRVARGLQNKVLQAMAMGLPVLATPVAAQPLDAVPERDLIVASGPEELASRLVDLFADAGARDALGRSGRRFVETHHSWDAVVDSVEALAHTVTGEAAPAARGAQR